MYAPPISKLKAVPLRSSTFSTQQRGRASFAPSQLFEHCTTAGNPVARGLRSQRSENDGAPVTSREAEPSWNFSNIPIFSTGGGERPMTTLPPLAVGLGDTTATKLRVGAVDDPLEYEADRAADHVMMQVPAPGAVEAIEPPRVSARSRNETSIPESVEAPEVVNRVLRSPGRPLESSARTDLEPHFGYDFSQVRVHSDPLAEQSAEVLGAKAYTVGRNVVFGANRYAPHTTAGRHLLAHELTHVVQQTKYASVGQAVPVLRRQPGGGVPVGPRTLTPLQTVAERLAKLAVGPASQRAQPKLRSPIGPVVTVVRDSESGQLFVEVFNAGVPENATSTVQAGIDRQQKRVASGLKGGPHTGAPGTHSEVNALDRAIAAREARIGRAVTEKELSTFELHNVWIKESRRGTTAPRCWQCAEITKGVKVTESVLDAESSVAANLVQPEVVSGAATSGVAGAETGASTVAAQTEETAAKVLAHEIPGLRVSFAKELARDIFKGVAKFGPNVAKGVIIGVVAGIISDRILHGAKFEQERAALDKANRVTPTQSDKDADFLLSAIPHPLLQIAAAAAARLIADIFYDMIQGEIEKRAAESRSQDVDPAAAARADKALDDFETGANPF